MLYIGTQPPWLYDGANRVNLTLLGDYYGRLLEWSLSLSHTLCLPLCLHLSLSRLS